MLHISAIKRQGLGPVWKAIADAHASATRKMPTPVLTRLLQEAVQHQAPKRAGAFRPKLRYAHQGGMNPPMIVIHGNSLEHVTDAYKRFLEGRFREHFKLTGTPLRIEMRSVAATRSTTREGRVNAMGLTRRPCASVAAAVLRLPASELSSRSIS